MHCSFFTPANLTPQERDLLEESRKSLQQLEQRHLESKREFDLCTHPARKEVLGDRLRGEMEQLDLERKRFEDLEFSQLELEARIEEEKEIMELELKREASDENDKIKATKVCDLVSKREENKKH